MQVGNLVNIGVQGFQNATTRASQAAQDIASQSVSDSTTESLDSNDLTSSLVQLKQAEIDAVASAKVIATADDLIGSLLDVKA